MALSGNLTTRLIAMLREWESRRDLGAPPPAAFAVPFPVQPKFGKVDDNPWTTGTATVSIWEWSGSAWADSTENETVSMPPWIATWSVATGTWVRLDYDYQSEKWIVTDPPIEVYGKVDSTWTSSTATVSIWANGSDTTANLTANMPPWITSWSVASTSWVVLKWDRVDQKWYATPMISQAVYTAWQYNASSDDIEKKTRTAVGPFTDAESAWTKVDDTNYCVPPA